MKATFKKPEFVKKVIDFATDVLIHLYEPLVKDGLKVISLADPTASGDLISKKQFQVFALPYLKRFTDWARSHGAHTLVHICGDTTDRLELFPETGASCISLDHKVNIARAKEVLGGKMCFAGNVDPVKVMLQGTVAEVESECKRIIETAGLDGGFVLMPGCDIPPDGALREHTEVHQRGKRLETLTKGGAVAIFLSGGSRAWEEDHGHLGESEGPVGAISGRPKRWRRY